jgi:hypothetical protein
MHARHGPSRKSRNSSFYVKCNAPMTSDAVTTGMLELSGYAFFTNTDFSFIAPKPSILQSML